MATIECGRVGVAPPGIEAGVASGGEDIAPSWSEGVGMALPGEANSRRRAATGNRGLWRYWRGPFLGIEEWTGNLY